MKRGEVYRVQKGSTHDPKRQRLFVIVSRQTLIDSKFSMVICAPVYSKQDGLSTQVNLEPNDVVKHPSAIHCDELVSIPKSKLTDYKGILPGGKIYDLNTALLVSLGLE